jgi:hypothetical protein
MGELINVTFDADGAGDASLLAAQSMYGIAEGYTMGKVNQIRDASGKLIQVVINVPDGTSQSAIDAINANNGKASTCTPQLFLNSIYNAGPGMIWSGVLDPADYNTSNGYLIDGHIVQQYAIIQTGPEANGFAGLGYVLDDGLTGNVFTPLYHGGIGGTALLVLTKRGTTAWVVEAGTTYTLHITATTSIVYTVNNTFTLPASIPYSIQEFYLDTVGNMYYRGASGTPRALGLPVIPTNITLSYTQACEYGPV